MSKPKYALSDSIMDAVEALLRINNLNPQEVELGMRLYSDGFEGNFSSFILTIKELSK